MHKEYENDFYNNLKTTILEKWETNSCWQYEHRIETFKKQFLVHRDPNVTNKLVK